MSALATGVRAALRHRRLAAVLWLSLLACASIALSPLRALFRPLDAGAFREALV